MFDSSWWSIESWRPELHLVPIATRPDYADHQVTVRAHEILDDTDLMLRGTLVRFGGLEVELEAREAILLEVARDAMDLDRHHDAVNVLQEEPLLYTMVPGLTPSERETLHAKIHTVKRRLRLRRVQ